MNRKSLVSFVLLAAILAVWAWLVWSRWDKFGELGRVSALAACALLALAACGVVARGLILRAVAAEVGADLPVGEAVNLVAATTFLNYLPMKAGVGAQTVYLKRRHRLPYARFAALFAASYLTQFLAVGVLGVVTSVGLQITGRGHLGLTIGSAVFLAACLAVALYPGRWDYRGNSRLLKSVAHGIDSWHALRGSRALLLRVGAVQVLLIGVRVVRLHLSFRLLGYADISLPAVLMATLVTFPVHLLSPVPGSLGLREGAMAWVCAVLGVGWENGFVGATLDRLSIMVVAFTWGGLATVWAGHLSGRHADGETGTEARDDADAENEAEDAPENEAAGRAPANDDGETTGAAN